MPSSIKFLPLLSLLSSTTMSHPLAKAKSQGEGQSILSDYDGRPFHIRVSYASVPMIKDAFAVADPSHFPDGLVLSSEDSSDVDYSDAGIASFTIDSEGHLIKSKNSPGYSGYLNGYEDTISSNDNPLLSLNIEGKSDYSDGEPFTCQLETSSQGGVAPQLQCQKGSFNAFAACKSESDFDGTSDDEEEDWDSEDEDFDDEEQSDLGEFGELAKRSTTGKRAKRNRLPASTFVLAMMDHESRWPASCEPVTLEAVSSD